MAYHQPITSLDSGGPIEFVVPGAGDAYIDLANTYLLVRTKVVRGVGTDIADDTPVAPVNNWLHSLFSQVDVHLNDTLVTPSSNTYPFRAYVETLLSYGAEAKKTQLTSQLWYKDTAGHMEATQENGSNAGLVERRRHIAGSRVVEMMGRLHVDLFHAGPVPNQRCHCQDTARAQQGRLPADGRRREPRLQGAHSGCCPVRAQGRVESDGGDGAHTGVGEGNGEVSAPPGRLQGILSSTHENLFLGTLPKRIILWCVDNDALNGAFGKNPFHAKNNAINFLAVSSTDVRCRRNRFSRTSIRASTFAAT